MSDTYSAPPAAPAAAPSPAPAAAPAAPAPTPHEVVVDPHPVSRPTPIGSQTAPSDTLQSSVEKAFARARGEKPVPAKARMGHNNPPEPMEKEPIDLRKRPRLAEPAAERGQQPATLAAESANPARAVESAPGKALQPAASPEPANPLPPEAPFREAPQRMDAQARAEWHAAPESVRGAVHRLHRDFGAFYQRAKPDIDAMNEIRPFHDLARSQGTTLARAVNNYWNMEQKLRGDPLAGLDVIVHNLNLRTPDGQQITFRDICHYVATQSPEQLKQLQTRNVQGAHNLQITELTQQVAQLANIQREMHARQQYARRRRQTARGVDQFAETHPRVDEPGFAETIVQELRSGHSLETAYRRAELLRPATAAAHTRTAPAAAQTRTQTAQTRTLDRSIHGAPSGSSSHSNGGSPPRRAGKERSLEDSITDAVRRVRGSL